jgi:hypothetical protein
MTPFPFIIILDKIILTQLVKKFPTFYKHDDSQEPVTVP